MAKNRSRDEQTSAGGILGAALRGLIAGIAVIIVLSLILTAAALGMDDPSRLLRVFALGTLFVGAVVCGVFAGMSCRDGAAAAGLVGGAAYVLILWLISLFFRGNQSAAASPLWSAVGYAVCLVLSLMGGFAVRRRGYGGSISQGKNPAAAARRRAVKRQ